MLFSLKTSLSIKYLGPIKVKCQSEDSFIDFVHNVNFQMILSDSGLDRRIQEMGLGNNMIQGIFS